MSEEHKEEDRIWADEAKAVASLLTDLPNLIDIAPSEFWISGEVKVHRITDDSVAYTVHYDYEVEQWYAIKEATE